MSNRGLYVHIPFCSHICSYCDFAKYIYDEKFISSYLDNLEKEILDSNLDSFSSIYVGGGTPSSLSEKELERLLTILKPYHKENNSFAFEANFENLTLEKIKILKQYGVNRVSLGLQTFNQDLLKKLNRYHDEEKIHEVINNLINEGITDINCDLIYGLPGQDFKILEEDVKKITSLPITHISTYALSVVPHTMFYIKKVEEVDQEVYREYYDYIVKTLKEKGFNRYEVSNFSKPGFESKHNLLYWRNEEYLGVGLGAASYIGNKRYSNTKSLTQYLKGERVKDEETLTKEDQEFYFLMLGLRLEEGVSIDRFKKLYNEDLLVKYQDKIKELEERRLVQLKDGRLIVTKENLFILDYILQKLLF